MYIPTFDPEDFIAAPPSYMFFPIHNMRKKKKGKEGEEMREIVCLDELTGRRTMLAHIYGCCCR